MSDDYKAFVRELKRRMIELNLTPKTAAEYMRVSTTTFYNWLAFKTTMSGEDMVRIINNLFGGKYEKRRGI